MFYVPPTSKFHALGRDQLAPLLWEADSKELQRQGSIVTFTTAHNFFSRVADNLLEILEAKGYRVVLDKEPAPTP